MVPQEVKQDTKPRLEMGRPSPHEDMDNTKGPRKGSGLPLGPTSLRGIAQDKEAPGFRGPAGDRTTHGGLIRTKEDKNANVGAR